ncbi:Fur family transcriptional regulator [Marinobacter sp. JSM 1782161]|uniref:Fur family transcriptional regulator n=1 Tax=Marinobacter sp. JSM 1782161 TaxID=2685906 RepID=UPI001A9F28FB|nr:transcriptional repressor [Marinobacter sp. JSM 1782161]
MTVLTCDQSTVRTDALKRAENVCAHEKAHFTTIRRRTLETLLHSPFALSAYGVQAQMKQDGVNLKAPTIYRALHFLTAMGFAHRIESLNAFIACTCGDHPGHLPGFSICRQCGLVTEMALSESLHRSLELSGHGFHVERTVFEIIGLCETCLQSEKE